ncbi:hypothetical protein [Mesorhizobium retamae]|uniref:Uncharacterized protein n=1 Tax=Mesorhizobium retamae TaxID=2912854 RepID=A0ABS9QBT5_9HYPH|nr:hypothetical protein [Mesorhizobium sp. IRAMC:0171]MCG7504276.1 hypothetical protein [Mesorhizobium sp. IRAMC:0171]
MRSILIPLLLASFCGDASAGEISSAYTDLVTDKDCLTYAKAGENDGDWADLSCSGYRGYPVLLTYDDARESVFYGFPPVDMTTSWESFVGFNSAGPKVEWRVETSGDVSVPFAAIHRRSVSSGDDGTKKTDVLVVAKVAQMEGRQGCTVALVAAGSPNANEEARKIADEKVRAFTCGKDKRITVGDVPAFGRVDN